MKRHKSHKKKPTTPQQSQTITASEQRSAVPEKKAYPDLCKIAPGWEPPQQPVEPTSYQSRIGAIPVAVNSPADKVAIELYVENSTDEDIILRHVTAEAISVLVENSLISPGQTRRVLMIMLKHTPTAGNSDGFMFCQGQTKNQCIVRCRGETLWVALQSGKINPLIHDMTAFSHTPFEGRRYLLCFKPPFKVH